MKQTAVLGPQGTFSEIAANKYIKLSEEDTEILFYPSITKAFNAIGSECESGIIPIENSLDGYVQPTLDLLTETSLYITEELVIPIQFAFVANASNLSEVKKVYVQFKSQGQCCRFLDKLDGVKIITTESNGTSLEHIKEGIPGEAAIIPSHMLNEGQGYRYFIDNVTDFESNETRFIVLSRDLASKHSSKLHKTSLVIMDAADKPGTLSRILNEFAEKNINITSIISRPTKELLGKYYFFIDIDGHYPEDAGVKEVIDKVSKSNAVKILGSYARLY
jgi:prephenate dehydratase